MKERRRWSKTRADLRMKRIRSILIPVTWIQSGCVFPQATNPYLTGMPQVGNTYSPYFAPSPIMPAIMGPADPTGVGSPLGVVPQAVAMPQKMPRTDRLEVCLPPNYIQQEQQQQQQQQQHGARDGTAGASGCLMTAPDTAYQVPAGPPN